MATWQEYGPETKAMLALGLPLAGSLVAQVALGATDTLMMGWYGVPELAALTVATSFFFILFLAVSGFAWAALPMIAAAAERGDDQEVRRVTRMGLWLVTAFGTLCVLPLWFAEPILLAAGQEPEIARLGQDYLRIACWSIFPQLWIMVLKSYLSALERTGVVLWATVFALLPNAAVNYVLIFGNYGAPEMGVRGAAVATLTVGSLTCALLLAYALRQFPEHAILARVWRPDREIIARVFRLGWPIALTSVSEVGLFVASALLMGIIGTVELAAHGIVLNIASLTFVVHLGLSQAATVRAGRAVGRASLVDLARAGKVAVTLSLFFVGVTVAFFLGVPETLVRTFLNPAEAEFEAVLAMGVFLLAMAALFQLVDAAQVVALGLLRGVQDTEVPMYMAAFSYWVVGLPVAAGLGLWLGLGAFGVWLGLAAGLAVAAALLMYRFWRVSGRRLPAQAAGTSGEARPESAG
ncbi:MAG: MATE family efflux transporter [Pseudomonadota bacterium]